MGARNHQRSKSRWLGFLFFAVLLHGLLLLIPFSAEDPGLPSEHELEISLLSPELEPPAPVESEPPEPMPSPMEVQEEPRQPEPLAEAMDEAVTDTDLPARDVADAPTATQLLEAISNLEWTEPETTARIARATTSEVYQRLMRPVLQSGNNLFDAYVLPTEVEIMDRWTSQGGVHQVVIRTPDGMTLCGRQEAPDDMRPWTVMPMMFRKCAGGGKRSARTPTDWRN